MTKFKKSIPMLSKNKNDNGEIILGVDPGYGRVGIAIIENIKNNQSLVHSECFETGENLPHPERLGLIAEHLDKIIKKYNPDKVAVETLLFSKNTKTALKVAEARGVILSESARNNVDVYEFNPNSIKLAVTGFGKSDKKQVIEMLHKIINIDSKKYKKIKYDDEYDAIATAITCAVIHKNN